MAEMKMMPEEDRKREINVLFLGGAKRVSFGRKLIEAGRRMGIEVRIFSSELNAEVPIASIGTVVIGHRWDSPDILDHLHHIVKAYKIDLILPFVDGAISVAASYLVNFEDGVTSPVVSAGKAEVLFDKLLSAKAFENAGLSIPATYTGGRPTFPLIAKPRHGSASKGIEIVRTIADFKRISSDSNRYLIQTYYPDREEYTVDCFISKEGEVLCVSPRRRLEVTGGEVSRTVTVDDKDLIEASYEAIARLELSGAVTLQYLRDLSTGDLKLMEINPRLGGGVVCSIHAGADIPTMILREVTGEAQEKCEPQAGVMICRYFDEVVFRQ